MAIRVVRAFCEKGISVKTNFQLSEKCVVPEEWKAGIGHDFRHYKGKMYRLLGLAPHSETLEPMAVYQLLYGDFGLWVRPAKMFFEEIEVDGRRMRRFELLDSMTPDERDEFRNVVASSEDVEILVGKDGCRHFVSSEG